MMLPLLSPLDTPNNADARVSAPSPFCIEPVWTSRSRPWKSFFKMKLTTPATASAPYTDDAPPVMTSTRSIAAAGIEFTSTAIVALTGTAR